MPNSLIRTSTLTNIDPAVIGSSDLFYFVHQAPGQYVTYSLQFADLFYGTNNISSDMKFNNNTLVIKTGKVGINKTPSLPFDVNGSGAISGGLYLGGNLNVNANTVITGSLGVASNTAILGSLSVIGTTTCTGAISMDGRLVDAFPSGTSMTFRQSTAPVGWTKITTYNDATLRVVSGSATSGGTVGFSTAFASHTLSGTVNGTTLTSAQMPSHTHTVTDPSHAHTYVDNQGLTASAGPHSGGYDDKNQGQALTQTTTGAATGISLVSTGGGTSHDHGFTPGTINLTVNYVDIIICNKN